MHEPLDPDNADLGQEGSPAWNLEIFRRAFCGTRAGAKPAVFEDAVNRLEAGFSVLVYCPGSCMAAAGQHINGRGDWKEYGKHPGGVKGIEEIWKDEANGIFEIIGKWIGRTGSAAPRAIYHNLDLMSDGHGGLYHDNNALTAMFSLIEATRNGVVCGLADRDAGRLPAAIEKAFTDTVTIKQIDFEGFQKIIPINLIESLGFEDELSEPIARQLAARLRWSDPIRAVRIMREAAQNGDLKDILQAISRRTRPVGYDILESTDHQEKDRLKGFDDDTLGLIRQQVIAPYSQSGIWKRRHTGLVLHGPSGTGKTTLARWIAREIGLPIKVASASEIKDPLYGNAERNAHSLFRDARRAAPCVLVLDDADDLFPARDQLKGSVAGADTGVVNAALQELDGFNGPLEDVLLILTTNRFSALDVAIRKRLGLHIQVPYPLDKEQVRRVINTVANEYDLDVSQVCDSLVLHFMDWVGPADPQQDIITPKGRRECANKVGDKNAEIFSQRDIAKAMLLLRGNATAVGSKYVVKIEDIERMKKYFSLQGSVT